MQRGRLPEGWEWRPFEEVISDVTRLCGRVLKREYLEAGEYPIIDQGQSPVAGYTDRSDLLFQGELPIILFGDHTCVFKYVDFPFVAGADGTKLLSVSEGFNAKFVFYYFRSLGMQSLSYRRHFKLLQEVDIPWTDPKTQGQIVAHIETLLPEVDEMLHLNRCIASDTERLMRSVLAQAFSDLSGQYESVDTAQVCTSITDGSHTTPPYVDTGIPFLFVKHIVNRFLDFGDTKFVSQTYYDGLSDTRKPEIGDVLYSVVGSYGVPVVVDTDRPFCFQRHIAILKPNREVVDPGFLRWILDAPQVLEQAHKVVTGSAQKTLTLTYLRKLTFPLPRSKELQRQIATRLNFAHSQIEEMRRGHEHDASLLAQLEQAILGQAFRGEL